MKNKHTFLKNIQTEKAEEPLILTEQDETKTRNFAPESNKDNIVSLFVVKKNCLIRTVLIFLLPAGRTFQPNDDNISSFSILITSSSFFFSQRHGKMSNTKKITHKWCRGFHFPVVSLIYKWDKKYLGLNHNANYSINLCQTGYKSST